MLHSTNHPRHKTELQVYACLFYSGKETAASQFTLHLTEQQKTTHFSVTWSTVTSRTADSIYCRYEQLHNSGLSLQSTENQRLYSKKHTRHVATRPAGFFSLNFQLRFIPWFFLLFMQCISTPRHTIIFTKVLLTNTIHSPREKIRTPKPYMRKVPIQWLPTSSNMHNAKL